MSIDAFNPHSMLPSDDSTLRWCLENIAPVVRKGRHSDTLYFLQKPAPDQLNIPVTALGLGAEVTESWDTVRSGWTFQTRHADPENPPLDELYRQIVAKLTAEDFTLLERICAFSTDGTITVHDRDAHEEYVACMVTLYGRKRIPPISDEELNRRAACIKPLVRQGDVLHTITQPCLRTIAFTWSPAFTGEAPAVRKVATLTTYHTYSYYGFFKPTIAEVLAQIPAELVEQVDAFELIGPEGVDDLNNHKQALNEGYHVAQAVLYRYA